MAAASGIRMGKVFVEIGADPSKFFAAVGKLNKSIGKIGSSMQSFGTKMTALGGAVVAPMFASAMAFANVGSALNDMSKRTGVATEALSVLQFAAEQTGTDMGSVEGAVKKMQKAIFAASDGSKEAADALAMVGLSASDLAGLSADEQMGKIADGLMAIQDPGVRAAVAMQIFGKSGTAILPMLEGGAAGMAAFADEANRLGLVMDSETAAKADALGDAVDSLKASMKMAFIQVGSAIAPILTDLARGLAVISANVGAFIRDNQQTVVAVLKSGVALSVFGVAFMGLGKAITTASATLSTMGKAAKIAMAPLTMLKAGASGVGKSFALAMPETLKLAKAINAAMLAAGGSVASFAASAGTTIAGFAASSAASAASLSASAAAGFARMSGAASTAARAIFPVFFSGFDRGIAAGSGFFSAAVRGFRGVAMSSGMVRSAMAAISNSTMATFSKSVATSLGSAYAAVATWASGVANRMAFAAKAVTWWASGVASQMAQYGKNLYAAAAATLASAGRMAAAYATTMASAVASFAASATRGLSTYLGSIVVAAVATTVNAARIAGAWIASALPGVLAFVGTAAGSFGAYLAACAAAVAGSVASAAAVAAAWLAPLAPFAMLAAAIGGAVALAYSFGTQIKSALGGVAELAGQAGSAISGVIGSAVADAAVVFSDLWSTATTTFNGIYDAIANGDLSGAMDILWAGLQAGWLRGVEALMGAVDPWVSMFQNTFTILGTEIAKTWDGLWTWVSNGFNTFGAYLQGAFDNVINGVLGAFDGMVAAVRKSWNWVQSFIRRGYDLAKENEKVDNEMEARRREREAARPGIEGRTRKAAEENAAATRDSKKRQEAMDAEAQATIDGREAENRRRADQRRADTQAAESNLANVTSGKREQRARNDQFAQLLKDVENATSVDALTDLQGEFEALHASGRLNSGQTEALTAAFDAAYGRVADAAEQAAGNDAGQKIEDGAKMAAEPRTQAEVAGTFSSMALGGMGFGGSLAQRQLDEQKKTNQILEEKLGVGEVAA